MTRPGELPPGMQPKVEKSGDAKTGMQKRNEAWKMGEELYRRKYRPKAALGFENEFRHCCIALATEHTARDTAERRARRVTQQVTEIKSLVAKLYKMLKTAIVAKDWELVKEALLVEPDVATREEVAKTKEEIDVKDPS